MIFVAADAVYVVNKYVMVYMIVHMDRMNATAVS